MSNASTAYHSITQACQYLLHNYPGAEPIKEYLNSRILPKTQATFQFGYFPPINELQLLTDLVGEDILLQHKLIFRKQIEDSLAPRIVMTSYFQDYPLLMPFHDAYGNIAGLVGRTLLSSAEMKQKQVSKYKNTTPFKKGNHLFGLYHNKQEILSQNLAYIVEGQFDVMKAMERGIKNIVATGNNSVAAYQFSIISRYTNNIILLLDNDEAGMKGRDSTIHKFSQLAHISNLYIPEPHKDIDEYLTACSDQTPAFVSGN